MRTDVLGLGTACLMASLGLVPSSPLNPAVAPTQPPAPSCSTSQQERLGLGDLFVDAEVRLCTGTETVGGGTRLSARTETTLTASRVVPATDFVSVRVITHVEPPTGEALTERCDRTTAVQRGGWRQLTLRCSLTTDLPVAPPNSEPAAPASGAYRVAGWAEWATGVGLSGTVPAGSPDTAPSRLIAVLSQPPPVAPAPDTRSAAASPAAASTPTRAAAAGATATDAAAANAAAAPPSTPAGSGSTPAELVPWLVAALLAAVAAAALHRFAVAQRRPSVSR